MAETLYGRMYGEYIWKAYTMKCETSFVTRNGTIACGATEPYPLSEAGIYAKPEFVAEHEGRAAFLLGLMRMYAAYEWSYVAAKRDGLASTADVLESIDTKAAFLDLMFLLCHDVGEIMEGDSLDDGSQRHEDNRSVEDEVMGVLYSMFPPSTRQTFQNRRTAFENYSGSANAQFCKAIDKAEAVAFQLFLYTKGRCGDVTKNDPPSQRDLRFAEILGTSRAVDVWCLHFRIATKHMDPQITRPILDFLKVGFMAAFGEVPSCMTIDVTDLELD